MGVHEYMRMQLQPRKATNISLDAALLTDALALKINLSRAAEEGVRRAVNKALVEVWLAQTAVALGSSNRFVEDNGLPLAPYRPFLMPQAKTSGVCTKRAARQILAADGIKALANLDW